jgi:hypothetical protein
MARLRPLIRLTRDTRSSPCAACRGKKDVRFLLVGSAGSVDRTWLRLCAECWHKVFTLNETLSNGDSTRVK